MKKLLLIALLIVGCEEAVVAPDVRGCTDATAYNFNVNANIFDNSCTYIDSCGVADMDRTNDCIQDCEGVWGGDAVVDNCEICDNDSTNDCESLHTNAEGFILKDEYGNEIYREFQGVSIGSITLSAGNILKLTVHFLNYDGEAINQEDYELRVSENDTSIAIIEVKEEQSDKEIHITGVNEGLTSFRLDLMNEGHSDYTSISNVSVTVNP